MSMHISAPTTVSFKDLKKNQTEVTIEPCYPGYGTTLGNAIRRVLLSSLPGAAVYAVKIKGIQHEYDVVEHVKEDMIEILMNLKKLRVVSHSSEPLTLELSVKGEKEVTAADIKKNAQADIISKDLVIATLTDKKAELSMEIMVKQGIGYEPVEERVIDKKEIGVIQIDSIYTPILNVGMTIENTRVGQRTDYDKIVLMVATDGTISAEQAIKDSIAILQEQFGSIDADIVIENTHSKKEKKADKEEKEEKVEETSDEA